VGLFFHSLVWKTPLFPRTPITPAGGLPGYGRLPPPPTTRHPPTPLGKRYAFPTARRPRGGEAEERGDVGEEGLRAAFGHPQPSPPPTQHNTRVPDGTCNCQLW